MRTAVDPLEADAQFFPKVIADIVDDTRLGRRGEADQRGRLAVSGVFPDEARDVAVIRPEVVAPLGYAMRFVDNPVSDFPLFQD